MEQKSAIQWLSLVALLVVAVPAAGMAATPSRAMAPASAGKGLGGSRSAPTMANHFAAIKDLRAPGKAKRAAAVKDLTTIRQKVINAAKAVLVKALASKKLPPNTLANVATEVLATYRAVEAVDLLLENIDARLDPATNNELPLGHQFPCAQALIRIGGRAVLMAPSNGSRTSFAPRASAC